MPTAEPGEKVSANHVKDGYKTAAIRPVFTLTLMDLAYTILAYLVFYLFTQGHIHFVVFTLLLYSFIARIFNIRHEKMHHPDTELQGIHRWLNDLLTLPYSPGYQEPFIYKRAKHLAHHREHTKKSRKPNNYLEDSHSLFEQRNLWITIPCCIFYEEVMVVVDFMAGRLFTRDRLISSFISLAGAGVVIYLAGIENFLWMVLAYRINLSMSWFVFSDVLHTDYFYSGKFEQGLPQFAKSIVIYLLGREGFTSILHHGFHHKHPNLSLLPR